MSLEVKVKTDEVKQAIFKLKGSNHGKNFNIPTNISGQNHLDAEEIKGVKESIKGITSLDDAWKGKGGAKLTDKANQTAQTGIGAVTLGAGVGALFVGTVGLPVVAAGIGFIASIGISVLLGGFKWGKDKKSVTDMTKDTVESGLKTVAGWFK